MKGDSFLQIVGIKGESQDAKYAGAIDVLSWSWSLSQFPSGHLGSGAGSGKVDFRDLIVTKQVDRATPNLITACCTGQHIESARLVVRRAGGKPLDSVKLDLREVFVTHYGVATNLPDKSSASCGAIWCAGLASRGQRCMAFFRGFTLQAPCGTRRSCSAVASAPPTPSS